MSLFNVIGFNKKIPFTDIGKKIRICHKPSAANGIKLTAFMDDFSNKSEWEFKAI